MDNKDHKEFVRTPAKNLFVNIYDIPTQDWQNLLLETERTLFFGHGRS